MKRLAALALIACTAGFAAAQSAAQSTDTAPAQPHGAGRDACKADVARLCPNVQPGGRRILACLKANQDQLSDACKALLKKREGKKPGAPGDASNGKN
ncbi:MAG: cysteine rich repeat-containing protein [Burkholderiaceae bacterium]|nr:cysteine rich repeat-containing protein [Burkholderiaceae bacterium]